MSGKWIETDILSVLLLDSKVGGPLALCLTRHRESDGFRWYPVVRVNFFDGGPVIWKGAGMDHREDAKSAVIAGALSWLRAQLGSLETLTEVKEGE